jgi:hypothetical protein
MTDINNIAKSIGSDGSVLDDTIALDVLKVLRYELHMVKCTLHDYRIGFDSNGFDIKIPSNAIMCKDSSKIMELLRNVEQTPGQIDLRSVYGKKPGTYTISAILSIMQNRVKDEFGLDLRAAGYDNDFVVLSFYPAIKEPEPEPLPMPPMPAIPEPGGEPAPEIPEPPMPGMPEPGGEPAPEEPPPPAPPAEPGMPEGAEPAEEIPMDEIDWGAMGI